MSPDTLAASTPLPQFEKRSALAPEIPGVRDVAGNLNRDPRAPQAVLTDLHEAKAHFEGLRGKGWQTDESDADWTKKLIKPILNAENARNPGLNAVARINDDKMVEILRALSTPNRNGQEGHVRFHVGIEYDSHRIAVDAFKHREGGFTLIAVDSIKEPASAKIIAALERKHPDIIKGALVIPTPNVVHTEGCRIFGVHTLNAMYDYQPEILKMHRQVYDRSQGRPAPRLSGPKGPQEGENTPFLAKEKDAFGMLPGKFFKHMQVKKPKSGETHTMLDVAEERNPALKYQVLNKQGEKGQTLRESFASQNPEKAPEAFSRADQTASLDKKRVVLIDRAIAHFQGLARAAELAHRQTHPSPNPPMEARSVRPRLFVASGDSSASALPTEPSGLSASTSPDRKAAAVRRIS
jgi:hypothetical protein